MNSTSPEVEFKRQVTELTSVVAHIVRLVNDQAKLLLTKQDEDASTKAEFVEDVYAVCKSLTKVTLTFKHDCEAMCRPYFLFASDLDGKFRKYLQLVCKLRSLLSEFSDCDAMQTDVKQNIELTIQKIKHFSSWVNCHPLAYEMESPSNNTNASVQDIEMPEPQQMVEEIKALPLWVVKMLFDTKKQLDKNSTSIYHHIQQEHNMLQSQIEALQQRMQSKDVALALRDEALKQGIQKITFEKNEQEKSRYKVIETMAKQISDLESEKNNLYQLAHEGSSDQVKELMSKLKDRNSALEGKNQQILNLQKNLNRAIDDMEMLKNQSKKKDETIMSLQKQVRNSENRVRIVSAQLRMSSPQDVAPSSTANRPGNLSARDTAITTTNNQVLEELSVASSSDMAELKSMLDELLGKTERDVEDTKRQALGAPPPSVDLPSALIFLSDNQRRECLSHLILQSSSNFDLFEFFERVFENHSNEGDEFLKSLLTLFSAQDKHMDLIYAMIDIDLNHSRVPTGVLSTESFPARIVKIYLKMVSSQYLHATLGPILKEFFASDVVIETDPQAALYSAMAETDRSTAIAVSAIKLQQYCFRFLEEIFESLCSIPLELGRVISHLAKRARLKFLDSSNLAVSAFIVRFYCAYLKAPPDVDRSLSMASLASRRSLSLVEEVLTCLVNSVIGAKDPNLKLCCSVVLEKYKSHFDDYVSKLTCWPPKTLHGPFALTAESLLFRRKNAIKALCTDDVKFKKNIPALMFKATIETPLVSALQAILRALPLESRDGPRLNLPGAKDDKTEDSRANTPTKDRDIVALSTSTGKSEGKEASKESHVSSSKESQGKKVSLSEKTVSALNEKSAKERDHDEKEAAKEREKETKKGKDTFGARKSDDPEATSDPSSPSAKDKGSRENRKLLNTSLSSSSLPFSHSLSSSGPNSSSAIVSNAQPSEANKFVNQKVNKLSLAKLGKSNGSIKGFLNLLFGSPALCVTIAKSLLTRKKCTNDRDNGLFIAKLLEAIGTLFIAHDVASVAIKGIISTEMTETLKGTLDSTTLPAGMSLTQTMFNWYGKQSLGQWLQPIWSRVLTSVIEFEISLEVDTNQNIFAANGRPIDVAANITKIKTLVTYLVDSAFKSFAEKFPCVGWQFLNHIENFSSFEPFEVLFTYFAEVVKDPGGHRITPPVDLNDNAKLTLRNIAQVLINIGRDAEPYLIGKEPKDRPFIEQYRANFTKLLSTEPHTQEQEVRPEVTWEEQSVCMCCIIDHLLDQYVFVEDELKHFPDQQHIVKFNMLELVDSLRDTEESSHTAVASLSSRKDNSLDGSSKLDTGREREKSHGSNIFFNRGKKKYNTSIL